MAKKKPYTGGKPVTFTCICCGKKVSLPSWGKTRKYCSINCWTIETRKRVKAKEAK